MGSASHPVARQAVWNSRIARGFGARLLLTAPQSPYGSCGAGFVCKGTSLSSRIFSSNLRQARIAKSQRLDVLGDGVDGDEHGTASRPPELRREDADHIAFGVD